MRNRGFRRCTYIVSIDAAASHEEVVELARSLSHLTLAGCEVVIFDFAAPLEFRQRQRTLRWVGRHVNIATFDLLRAAVDYASCEKIIIASNEARCTAAEIEALCNLLDVHEVVEPEEFVAPMSWWGAIEAGGLLLHRGVDVTPSVRSTVAFRRSAFRPLRGVEDDVRNTHFRRLTLLGAETYSSRDLFIRREPSPLSAWFRVRTRETSADLSLGLKTMFFFAVVPILTFVALLGGIELVAAYASVAAFATMIVALRGRSGAGRFFPLHCCLYAPMWIAARSIIIYFALLARMRGEAGDPYGGSSYAGNVESRAWR